MVIETSIHIGVINYIFRNVSWQFDTLIMLQKACYHCKTTKSYNKHGRKHSVYLFYKSTVQLWLSKAKIMIIKPPRVFCFVFQYKRPMWCKHSAHIYLSAVDVCPSIQFIFEKKGRNDYSASLWMFSNKVMLLHWHYFISYIYNSQDLTERLVGKI